jgi:hypothetical protein
MNELEDNDISRLGWKIYQIWFHMLAVISIFAMITCMLYNAHFLLLALTIIIGVYAVRKLYFIDRLKRNAWEAGMTIIEYINTQQKEDLG